MFDYELPEGAEAVVPADTKLHTKFGSVEVSYAREGRKLRVETYTELVPLTVETDGLCGFPGVLQGGGRGFATRSQDQAAMRMERWITTVALLAASAGICVRAVAQDGGNTGGASQSAIQGMVWTSSDSPLRDDGNRSTDEAELLANSREAGLLTDWHLEGRFGRGGEAEFRAQVRAGETGPETGKESGRRG